MEYTVQNLEYAVSVFYNGEQTERVEAHAWLTAAQRVPDAWQFVWELLQPNKGTEIQFYAATTLHTKILRCWSEVPPENHEELKEKILQAIFTYSKGPKIVTNRLCISLAAFIFQQGTSDLATVLRPLSSAENTSLLLEVLTVIPEEYNSMTMGSLLRAKNRSLLQQACPAVLDDMLRYLHTVYNDYSKEGPSEETIQSWQIAATCANSWLMLGGEDSPDSATALPDRLPLCRALMTTVHVLFMCNEAVSDSALDTCEASLGALRAAGSTGDAARYPAAALPLLSELAALTAPVMARDNVPNSINEELLSALITTSVALAECHAATLVKAVEKDEDGQGGRQLLEVLLAAQGAPGHYPLHETRSNLVIGLWYTLQDEVLNVIDSTHQLNPVWREVFSRLLMSLVTKSEMAPESALSRDDQELLRCYRQDIADTVMYCFGILGECCWSTVESAFSLAESEARREAALHVFLALADAAPTQRTPSSLTSLLRHAVHIANTSHNKNILNTALDCLGGYASWIATCGLGGLGRECARAAGAALARSPTSAALALRKLCTECGPAAAELAADIVQAAQSDVCKHEPWVRRQLLCAAGAALAAAEPSYAAPLLRALAASLVADLTLQVEVRRSSEAAESAAALVSALGAQPVLLTELVRALLPVLPAYAQHHALVEPMFQILKQTILTLTEDCVPLAGDIAQLTVTGFNTQPCAVGLDVVKLLVLMVGSDSEETSRVLHTCVCLSARVVATTSSCSDVTEALFVLLHTITKKTPQYLHWIEDLLPQLVCLGSESVRLWEACAARAACLWLSALATQRPAALHVVAPGLTHALLACIGGGTPRNQIEPLSDLLLALNRAEVGDLATWLRQALAVVGFPTPHATEAHKHKFIAAVIKEKSSKRRLLETVREFSLVCRGLVGTEYGRQTLASKQLVT